MENFFKKRRYQNRRETRTYFVSTKKDKNVFRPLSAILISLLTLTCLYLFYRSDIFFISEISFANETPPIAKPLISAEILTQEMTHWKGYSVFTFPYESEAARISSKYPALKNINIKRKFPDTLIVTYTERIPAAIVTAKNGQFVIDETAYVYSPYIEGIEAPLFNDDQKELSLSQQLNAVHLSFALEIVTKFQDLKLKPLSFEFFNGSGLLIETDSQMQILFTSDKDATIQLTTLQVLLKNATIEGRKLKKVDVRFDRPVIVE